MKYVLIHNLLSSCSKKPIYVSEKEEGNFISTTDDVKKAIAFNSIEELDAYAKERKLKKSDFVVLDLEKENKFNVK